MQPKINKTVFSLSNPHRGLRRQEFNVICFEETGIRLLLGTEEKRNFPYFKLIRIGYVHFRKGPNTFLRMLGGGFSGKHCGSFTLVLEDERIEMKLELDAEYRSADLRELFRSLYQSKIPLTEKNHAGLSMFLLETMAGEKREEKIIKLQSET